MKKLPFKSASLNPLDFIDRNSPTAVDECKSMADAIIITQPDEKNPHFNRTAGECVTGYAALTCWYGGKESRSLQNVDMMATIPEAMADALDLMGKPDDTGEMPYNGMLARMGGRMRSQMGEEKASVLSTMAAHLAFLRTPAIAAVTKTSSFTPAMKQKKQTVYIVCPPEHIRSMAGWIRLMVWTLFKSVVKDGLGEQRKVYAILDEAASLGSFDALDDAVDKFRGYGLRTHFYYQSFGQLKKCWPKNQGTTLLSNCTKVFFGTADYDTAELESKMGGEETILVEDYGEGENNGWNRGASEGQGYSRTRGASGGSSYNRNTKQIARKLAKPEEILTWSPQTCLTFVPSNPPIVTTLVRIFEKPDLYKPGGYWMDAIATLFKSGVLLAVSIVMAISLTIVLVELGVGGVVRNGAGGPQQWVPPLEPVPLVPVPLMPQPLVPEPLPPDVVRGE